MDLPDIIQSKLPELTALCKKYHVAELFIFGSVLTDQFHASSDLDFIVRFGELPLLDYADNFFELRDNLSALFQREIDLVEMKSVKNVYFKSVLDASKVLVYDGSGSRIEVVA